LKLDPYGTVPAAIRWAAFSPDDRTLAIASQFGSVTLWDATTGRQRATLLSFVDPTRDGGTVAFSNDGKMLAAGDREGVLRLWNVETGELQASFKGHAAEIASVAFSPDGKSVLSGSADKTARLWNVVTGQELLSLKEHKSRVTLVVFAPDGNRLATASGHEVKLWFAATEPEAAAFRVELDPDDPDGPRAANLSGDRLVDSDQPEEAEAAYLKAQARLEELTAALPNIPDYRRELAYSLVGAALLPLNTREAPIAEQAHRRVRELYETLSPDQKQSLAGSLYRRGYDQGRLKRWNAAAALFEESVKLAPAKGAYWNKLGAAQYRVGDWQAALEAFEQSMKLRNGGDAFDWFFLAMAHWQLGEKEEARKWYDQAAAWMDKNQPKNDDLRRFRAEAAELLELEKKTN
jgi:tetratricopeptide (TPR) repeat protein